MIAASHLYLLSSCAERRAQIAAYLQGSIGHHASRARFSGERGKPWRSAWFGKRKIRMPVFL